MMKYSGPRASQPIKRKCDMGTALASSPGEIFSKIIKRRRFMPPGSARQTIASLQISTATNQPQTIFETLKSTSPLVLNHEEQKLTPAVIENHAPKNTNTWSAITLSPPRSTNEARTKYFGEIQPTLRHSNKNLGISDQGVKKIFLTPCSDTNYLHGLPPTLLPHLWSSFSSPLASLTRLSNPVTSFQTNSPRGHNLPGKYAAGLNPIPLPSNLGAFNTMMHWP